MVHLELSAGALENRGESLCDGPDAPADTITRVNLGTGGGDGDSRLSLRYPFAVHQVILRHRALQIKLIASIAVALDGKSILISHDRSSA